MPPKTEAKNEKRLTFLADRLAIVLSDIVQRDMDYSDICYDDFYRGERADELRRSKQYQVCMDFVRTMVKNYDKKQKS